MRPSPRLIAPLDDLAAFDEIIDARTPAEFAEDHIPGAVNRPVLSDEERVRVGTLYKQVSPFEAKKVGAALVARNIADHLERHFSDRPKDWRPLVYCWRGGNRSGAMVHILAKIGWRAAQLDGGYKAYRRQVLADLADLPGRFSFRVVCGATGTGKSALLRALATAGAQVLDLEDLAAHKGSLLGGLPERPQPGQRYFDSLLWAALKGLDPARTVYVEAESKKIGNLRMPDALLAAMWASPCLRLSAPLPARVGLLKGEYAHFLADPEALCERLAFLVTLHGKEKVARWQAQAREGRWDELVGALLTEHYDPAYHRSTRQHYPLLDASPELALTRLDETELAEAAHALAQEG